YGSKAIGVAISDELRLIVRPLTTIRRGRGSYRQVIDKIRALVTENGVGLLAVGLPINMDGTRGEAATRVEKFVADLQNLLAIPIVFVDERLTSYEADRILRERGVKDRRTRSDEFAAAVILQDFLDQEERRQKTESAPSQSSS
ncbi:MAG: Holliday junction resolvase RuvX, partial [Blastocatellia bacterium]|nr:Holliday junction resolvase RuvX [Blastocatellia bacterium]